ncbi:MAG: hypothetical protein H6700_10315 [Myxococcales bacterium]|nr:hypothetical protein [Myxococcales bacterium]
MPLRTAATLAVALLAVSGSSCGHGTVSAADCMRAMARVDCPPGTAPTSGSAGNTQVQAGVQVFEVGASMNDSVTCDYQCASICQCGIERVESSGGVVCTPCFGVVAQASTTSGGAPPARPAQTPTQNRQQQVAARVSLNYDAAPLFEHHNLTAPFQPDPFAITVRAGGNDAIAEANVYDPTGGTCNGWVNAGQPDIAITYTSRGTPLTFSVNSESDTTLIVNLPDGTWRCNDDANGNTLNPRLYFGDGMSGRYSVWVGTYQRDGTFPIAQFRATTQLRAN